MEENIEPFLLRNDSFGSASGMLAPIKNTINNGSSQKIPATTRENMFNFG